VRHCRTFDRVLGSRAVAAARQEEGPPVAAFGGPDSFFWQRQKTSSRRYNPSPFGAANPDQYLSRQRISGQSETGIGDSLYKKAGCWGEAAIVEYKTSITFFPSLTNRLRSDADRDGTIYRRWKNRTRDRTEEVQPRPEFQNFPRKYSDYSAHTATDSPARSADGSGRGNFRVAYFITFATPTRHRARLDRANSNRYPL